MSGFVIGGAILTATGIVLAVLGVPHPAVGLAPIGSAAGVSSLLDYVPLVAVIVLVSIALACVVSWRRDWVDAGPALVGAGAAGIGVVVVAVMAAGRLAYDASGDVLPAVSLVVAGGTSILVAAVIGAVIRE